MAQVIDTFGVPEFYSDKLGAIEDAGNGMLRTIRCISRGGLLIPVYCSITPAITVLQDTPTFREIAQRVAMGMRIAH